MTTTKKRVPTMFPLGTKVTFTKHSIYTDTPVGSTGVIVHVGSGEFNYMRTVRLDESGIRVHACNEDYVQSDSVVGNVREAALEAALDKIVLMAGRALDLEAKSERPSSAAMRAFSLIEAAADEARKL